MRLLRVVRVFEGCTTKGLCSGRRRADLDDEKRRLDEVTKPLTDSHSRTHSRTHAFTFALTDSHFTHSRYTHSQVNRSLIEMRFPLHCRVVHQSRGRGCVMRVLSEADQRDGQGVAGTRVVHFASGEVRERGPLHSPC